MAYFLRVLHKTILPKTAEQKSTIWSVFKSSFKLLIKNNPLRMAGATAFFTIFALPPILIIIVQVFSLFVNPDVLKHQLFIELSGILETEAVQQIISLFVLSDL